MNLEITNLKEDLKQSKKEKEELRIRNAVLSNDLETAKEKIADLNATIAKLEEELKKIPYLEQEIEN